MSTPLEKQILEDFEERITASDAVPDELAEKLMTLARGNRLPAADSILETIKANVGDQTV